MQPDAYGVAAMPACVMKCLAERAVVAVRLVAAEVVAVVEPRLVDSIEEDRLPIPPEAPLIDGEAWVIRYGWCLRACGRWALQRRRRR